jgi:peptidoglycan-associated lipoprotein
MKLTKISNLILMGLVLTIVSTGCKKKPNNVTILKNPGLTSPNGNHRPDLEPAPPVIPAFDPNSINNTAQTPSGISFPGTGHEHDGWKEERDALKGQTVYFEFDKSSIKSSEQSKLEEVATYLKGNSSAAVRVEGNCDERGTEEYNRSLGERRALAAREALAKLGIDVGRVDVTTFGEDKPAVPGHDESAYSKNRRDEFIVLTPPK